MDESSIATIVADYLRAGLSRKQAAQRLNQRGYRTLKNNYWVPTSMGRVWSLAAQINMNTEQEKIG